MAHPLGMSAMHGLKAILAVSQKVRCCYLSARVVNIDLDSYIGNDSFINPVKSSEDFEMAGFLGLMATGAYKRLSDTDMRTVHNMFSRWSARGLNEAKVLDNFNRFYTVFPEMEMSADLKTYTFITRPELNILSGQGITLAPENAKDVRLQFMAQYCPEVLPMLTKEYSAQHDFISYLMGRTESLEIPDYQIRTSDFTIPFFSYKYSYPTVTNESETGGSFNITFREDNELRITNMFQFWIYYQDAVIKNKMSVKDEMKWGNFFDYMCSVYQLVCDPTTQKILFWTKYTGCFPTSVSTSTFSHNLHSTTDNKITVGFNYIRVEHNNPMIIADFQNNTVGGGYNFEENYNYDFGTIGDTLVGCPKIIEAADHSCLLLKWTPDVDGPSVHALNGNPDILGNMKVAYKNVQTLQDQTANELRANYHEIVTADDTAQIGKNISTGLRTSFDQSLRGQGNLVKHLQTNSDTRR